MGKKTTAAIVILLIVVASFGILSLNFESTSSSSEFIDTNLNVKENNSKNALNPETKNFAKETENFNQNQSESKKNINTKEKEKENQEISSLDPKQIEKNPSTAAGMDNLLIQAQSNDTANQIIEPLKKSKTNDPETQSNKPSKENTGENVLNEQELQEPITVTLTIPGVNEQNIDQLNAATVEYKKQVDKIIQGNKVEQDKLQTEKDSEISINTSKNPVKSNEKDNENKLFDNADIKQVISIHDNQNLRSITSSSNEKVDLEVEEREIKSLNKPSDEPLISVQSEAPKNNADKFLLTKESENIAGNDLNKDQESANQVSSSSNNSELIVDDNKQEAAGAKSDVNTKEITPEVVVEQSKNIETEDTITNSAFNSDSKAESKLASKVIDKESLNESEASAEVPINKVLYGNEVSLKNELKLVEEPIATALETTIPLSKSESHVANKIISELPASQEIVIEPSALAISETPREIGDETKTKSDANLSSINVPVPILDESNPDLNKPRSSSFSDSKSIEARADNSENFLNKSFAGLEKDKQNTIDNFITATAEELQKTTGLKSENSRSEKNNDVRVASLNNKSNEANNDSVQSAQINNVVSPISINEPTKLAIDPADAFSDIKEKPQNAIKIENYPCGPKNSKICGSFKVSEPANMKVFFAVSNFLSLEKILPKFSKEEFSKFKPSVFQEFFSGLDDLDKYISTGIFPKYMGHKKSKNGESIYFKTDLLDEESNSLGPTFDEISEGIKRSGFMPFYNNLSERNLQIWSKEDIYFVIKAETNKLDEFKLHNAEIIEKLTTNSGIAKFSDVYNEPISKGIFSRIDYKINARYIENLFGIDNLTGLIIKFNLSNDISTDKEFNSFDEYKKIYPDSRQSAYDGLNVIYQAENKDRDIVKILDKIKKEGILAEFNDEHGLARVFALAPFSVLLIGSPEDLKEFTKFNENDKLKDLANQIKSSVLKRNNQLKLKEPLIATETIGKIENKAIVVPSELKQGVISNAKSGTNSSIITRKSNISSPNSELKLNVPSISDNSINDAAENNRLARELMKKSKSNIIMSKTTTVQKQLLGKDESINVDCNNKHNENYNFEKLELKFTKIQESYENSYKDSDALILAYNELFELKKLTQNKINCLSQNETGQKYHLQAMLNQKSNDPVHTSEIKRRRTEYEIISEELKLIKDLHERVTAYKNLLSNIFNSNMA